MSLSGISLLDAPTSVAWTGGTATVFEKDGTPVATGLRVTETTETDPRLQMHVTFKSQPHQMQSDGTFSKSKRRFVVTIPFELADGTIDYQTFRGELFAHPEFMAVAGNLDNLRHLAGQCILDAETDNYYDYGSTS